MPIASFGIIYIGHQHVSFASSSVPVDETLRRTFAELKTVHSKTQWTGAVLCAVGGERATTAHILSPGRPLSVSKSKAH